MWLTILHVKSAWRKWPGDSDSAEMDHDCGFIRTAHSAARRDRWLAWQYSRLAMLANKVDANKVDANRVDANRVDAANFIEVLIGRRLRFEFTW
jgi:hypothetical protein